MKDEAALRRQSPRVLLNVVSVLLLSCGLLCSAEKQRTPAKYQVVIIQAAGYPPEEKKPEGVDAITHPTTKGLNTYVFTSKLVEHLARLGAEVKVVSYLDCRKLACLDPVEKDGTKQFVDLAVFAGPAENGKQQKKLLNFFPQLEGVVKKSPNTVFSTLVPAWYPDTKGRAACKYTDAAFKKAGAKTVMGVSLLTPDRHGKSTPGVSEEKMQKVLKKFADDLIGEVAKH